MRKYHCMILLLVLFFAFCFTESPLATAAGGTAMPIVPLAGYGSYSAGTYGASYDGPPIIGLYGTYGGLSGMYDGLYGDFTISAIHSVQNMPSWSGSPDFPIYDGLGKITYKSYGLGVLGGDGLWGGTKHQTEPEYSWTSPVGVFSSSAAALFVYPHGSDTISARLDERMLWGYAMNAGISYANLRFSRGFRDLYSGSYGHGGLLYDGQLPLSWTMDVRGWAALSD